MLKSIFIKGKVISKPKAKLELWLKESGYHKVSEMYPGAVLAESLIDDYFRDYPERAAERVIAEHHATALNWVSDYIEESDDEEPDVTKENDENWS